MLIKEYKIDIHSYDNLLKHFNEIKSLLGEIRKQELGILSAKERVEIIYNNCVKIFNTDISEIYSNLSLDETRKYYIYAHCDPNKKIALKKNGKSTFAATLGMTYRPIYIGKGTENRAYDLDRNEIHRKIRQRLKKFNKDLDVKILKDNLTEKEALMYESKLIDIFGLISYNGELVNLDEGINKDERRKIYKNELENISMFYKNSV